MKSKQSLNLILVLPFLLLSCKTSHPVDKTEALNSIKILNADIISFINRSSELPGFKAIGFLLKQPSAPLPFQSDTSGSHGFRHDFSFTAEKGIYKWDTAKRVFVKAKDTSLILIRFPMPGRPGSECSFILYEYETGKTRSKPVFPINIRAKLFTGNKEELNISHRACISEGMISSISSKLNSDSLGFSFEMKRDGSFSVKNGKLNSSLLILEKGKEIMRATLNVLIDYHPPLSYSVQKISIEQKLFNTELSGTIDYGSINPSSDNYDQEFNKNTRLELSNSDDKGTIGNIVLSPDGNSGRFDYFIRLSDGSEYRLTDQIMVLKKLSGKTP